MLDVTKRLVIYLDYPELVLLRKFETGVSYPGECEVSIVRPATAGLLYVIMLIDQIYPGYLEQVDKVISLDFMLICFISSYLWYSVCLYSTTVVYFFHCTTNYYTDTLDLLYRLTLNNFHLTSFYYIWTASWWSPVLTTCIIYMSLLYIEVFLLHILTVSLIILATVLKTSLSSYWALNSVDTFLLDKAQSFNTLLINPLNQYHPNLFLLLISLVYALTILLWLRGGVQAWDYSPNWERNLLKYVSLKLSLVSCATLFLGSWWAFQEGSWGGWWNWDLSEYFSLVILLSYTYLIHLSFGVSGFILMGLRFLTTFALVLLMSVFVQYNLTNTSHAFGQDFSRGSILNRPQQLILFALIMLVITVYRGIKLYYFTLTGRILLRWANFSTARLSRTYGVWGIALAFLLAYVTLRVFTKSSATLTNFWGFSVLVYTFSWRFQLLSIVTLLFLVCLNWHTVRFALSVVYLYSPTASLLLVTGLFSGWYGKFWTHIIILSSIITVLFYAPFTILNKNVLITPSNNLNTSLDATWQLLTSASFDAVFAQLSTASLFTSHLGYTTTLFLETTTGSISLYYYYLAPNYTEHKLCLSGLYTLWVTYELEFVAPILSASVLLLLCSFYAHTSTRLQVRY